MAPIYVVFLVVAGIGVYKMKSFFRRKFEFLVQSGKPRTGCIPQRLVHVFKTDHRKAILDSFPILK